MFEEIIKRIPDIHQTCDVSLLRSDFINGYKHIPVEFTPEKA